MDVDDSYGIEVEVIRISFHCYPWGTLILDMYSATHQHLRKPCAEVTLTHLHSKPSHNLHSS